MNDAGLLPVTFIVSERARRAIGGTVGYETNYGLTVGAWWEHRNLFGGAQRLRLEATMARIGVGNQGDPSQMTYRVGATLTDPGILGRPLAAFRGNYSQRERLARCTRTKPAKSYRLEAKV